MPCDSTPSTNLDRLIDHLRDLPLERFDMSEWCGTACCIAGHAYELGIIQVNPSGLNNYYEMGAPFGMDVIQASEAFALPGRSIDMLRIIPISAAVSMLEHFRDTGIVDWARIIGARP